MDRALKHFQYLLALAEHSTFASAAKSINVTQPALSQAIRQLEKSLGVRLFDRTPKGATLNPFGEIAARYARQLIGEIGELRRELAMLQGVSAGDLSIVAGAYAAEISGHTALAMMLTKHPGVRASIKILEWNQVAEPLLARQADLALAEVTIADGEPKLVAEPIGTHPMVFVSRPGHPLTRRRQPLTTSDITSFPWACMPVPARMYNGFPARRLAAGTIEDASKRFIPSVRVDTVRGALQVAANSDAISAAPPHLIADELATGTLVKLAYSAPWLRLQYGFIYLRDRSLSPSAKAFIEMVRHVEQRLIDPSRQGRITTDGIVAGLAF